MWKELIIYSFENVRHRKIRSVVTVLGIVIGIAAIISLLLLSSGMKNAVNKQFSQFGENTLEVVPSKLRGPPTGEHALPLKIVSAIESVAEVDYANPLILNFATVVYGGEKEYLFVNGYDTDLSGKGFIDLDFTIIEGRLFSSQEHKAALLGYDIAKETFEQKIKPKNSITINDQSFKVIGVFERTGGPFDDRVYIPLDDAEHLFGQKERVNAVFIRLKQNSDQARAQVKIQKEIEKIIDDELFDLFTPQQLLAQFESVMGVLQAVLVGIATISLLVGSIGIMNSMFTSVMERTKEIGTMKAIGATKQNILMIFLCESALLSTLGGTLGIICGIILAKAIGLILIHAGFTLFSISLSPLLFVVGLLVSLGVGILAGIIPAYKAMSLQPIEALRYE